MEIEEICGQMRSIDVSGVVTLFQNLNIEDVRRVQGHVELLIGSDHLSIHPKELEEVQGLRLYESAFGTRRILCGSHPLLEKSDHVSAYARATAASRVENTRVMFHKHLDPGIDFFSAEEFGVKIPPNCDRCRNCKNCTIKMHEWSKVEQRELAVIEGNLELDPLRCRWSTNYPFKCDPSVLEDNKGQALKMMMRQEERLLKKGGEEYKEQFDDFVKRGVFKEISKEEQEEYKGPVFYVTHHEVFIIDSNEAGDEFESQIQRFESQ